MNKQAKRVVFNIILGMIISVIIFTILITIGYIKFNNSEMNSLPINLLGINIFQITGGKGVPNNNNMTFLGIVFSMITVLSGEFLASKKGKRKDGV